MEVPSRSRRVPRASSDSEARCSTAAGTPASSSKAYPPLSKRSGTRSGTGASFSGSSSTSSAGSATTAPTCGPHHMSAATARKSAPSARTSSRSCAAACVPSTKTNAPTACARRAMAATSGRVPIAELAAVTATSRVRGPSSSSYCQSGSSPVSMSTSAQRTPTPARTASSTHGRTLASWSSRLTTTSSPGRQVRASARATVQVSREGSGPRTTPVDTPPTRSATAVRALATSPSARADAGNTPPRSATGTRIACATACTTFSGSSAPACPSACTRPSERPGKRPRTRATSSRASPGPMALDTRRCPWRPEATRPTPAGLREAGEDGDMTAPDNGSGRPQQVVVVGPDGRPVGTMPVPDGGPLGARGDDPAGEGGSIGEMVEQPAKVMRIGTMIKQLLEEVRAAPLDDASRNRLRDIHASSIRELEQGLAPELREELERITLPFTEGETPSDAELRIAQAQLVGWLEGVFHGIQTALFAQQMAARAQLEEMRRRALPGGSAPAPGPHPHPGGGQYL